MGYIDSALLNFTERVCRTLQRLTGRTNVWLAVQLTNLSIIIYFVWAGLQLWTNDGAWRIAGALFCGGLLYLLAQTVLRVPVERYESSAYQRVAKGLRNPRRVRDALMRISFLTLSVLLFYPILQIYLYLRSVVPVLTYLLILLTTVVLYLLACDPLPPCASQLRQWLRGSAPSRLGEASLSD
jgi:hypothetical protein